MNITIQRLTLTNFKGVRSLNIDFSQSVTSIHGRNRTGKTTVADAIIWCLFGKDSKGNTKFGIRTRDELGRVIPDISHEVEMQISCDGIPHTLQRSLRADGTYAYFVDAVKTTAGDYNTFISNFVGEETFRAITSPTYFTSLPWKDQRKFLSDMVGTITNEQVAAGDHRFDELLGILAQTDLETHIKHISYKIKQTQTDLERIPVRIDEQRKAMPDVQDYPSIDIEIDAVQCKLQGEQADLAKAQLSGTDDARQKSIREKLSFARKRIDNMERSARNMVRELTDQHDREVRQSQVAVSEAKMALQALQNKVSANIQLVERTKQTIDECEHKAVLIRQQWADNKSAHLEISEAEAVCPTCGQPLPEDKLKEKIASMREQFNARREAKYKELRSLAEQVKKTQAQANADISTYQSENSQANADIEELKKQIEQLSSVAAEASAAPVKTYEEVLSEKDDYAKVKAEVKSLEDALENGGSAEVDPKVIEELKAKVSETQQRLSFLTKTYADLIQRDRIQRLITGIEEERENLMTTLDQLHQQKDIALEFNERASSLLEDSVNAHFSFVQWRMFRELLNGTAEPYCECMVRGIPFSDLNSADRINAGLDIINTLSGIYKVSAPIIIDNAESVNNLMETTGQQIRLYVSEDDSLTIK
jgi:DNA repair exonuclease SbcCD ATPase subunit